MKIGSNNYYGRKIGISEYFFGYLVCMVIFLVIVLFLDMINVVFFLFVNNLLFLRVILYLNNMFNK